MRIALYEPDIPQNAGAIFRLAACLGVPVDVIEPCGFVLDDRRLKRVSMDYGARAEVARHDSWRAFGEKRGTGRLVLLTTKGDAAHTDFAFEESDTLLLGRESAGVPDAVHNAADARLIVPMAAGARSLNVVTAAAIVLGEALRQTNSFADLTARMTNERTGE
jgi:tRNA (cytidine/uridine-2'-O-)-methyltransferase